MKLSDVKYELYAVTGREYHPQLTLYSAVKSALDGGTSIVQLREKNLEDAEFLRLAKELLPLCRNYNVPLIINDNVEVAKLCDADGVHVGQSDMALAAVRKIVGQDKLIGVSATDVDEAVYAWHGGANYIGVGAMFPTGSKSDAQAVSLATLKEITAKVPIPVVAIGGINLDNIPLLANTGIAGISVISALFGADDITGAAKELRKNFYHYCQSNRGKRSYLE